MTFKNITNNSRTFLYRLSYNLKKGSIKLHIILNDDITPHSHPWDFQSIILFGGYNETIWPKAIKSIDHKTYRFLSINKKDKNIYHLVRLRRIFGIKIPCITIGLYSEKKQLCSLCQELGYCKSKKIL